ncbi:ferredoxin reductase-like protein [Schizophyllum commune H4-8]|uniref:NADH-cytochrome b5 reductase n=1 Tax=Schizophyllum commune (strain H4-8 / FGSC 9210) TaxID=578458 RepID=D8PMC7_SCHCM|nr:ferredoxin reductase-like protein [Schizophyllum commune H4-8]XP_050202512.1 ferredoxin reductase-like protein [Schizophyllum commune H4-8]KAI5898869.1 ferredoxin reductase-like protein [Schizophyllum commune H4-8]KAI5898875.1 ferredoxin reductase-like protein [Schizophyllum commune H4-8]
MSATFLRATSAIRPLSQSARFGARRFASTAPETHKKASNAPLYFALAGLAGAGAYYTLYREDAAPVPKQEKSPLDPDNFIDFKLKKVIPYNHNTSTFVFELPDNQSSMLPVASCVVTKSDTLLDDKGKPVIRPYTPITPSDKQGELSILIKKYDTGKMSKHIFEMKEGDKLGIKGPIMKIPWQINQFDEVAMIAGGSGITPMHQILEYALKNKENKTRFTLIFANVTEKDILLKEQFDEWEKKYPNTFKAVYTLDKPSEGWKGPTGYVNAELIKQHVAPATLGEKVKVLVCGPPGQVASLAGKKAGYAQGELSGVLKELNYTPEQVFKF